MFASLLQGISLFDALTQLFAFIQAIIVAVSGTGV